MHAYETKDHIVLANNLCKIGKKKTPPLIKGTNIATKKIYKEIIKKEYQSASAQQPPLHVSKKKPSLGNNRKLSHQILISVYICTFITLMAIGNEIC